MSSNVPDVHQHIAKTHSLSALLLIPAIKRTQRLIAHLETSQCIYHSICPPHHLKVITSSSVFRLHLYTKGAVHHCFTFTYKCWAVSPNEAFHLCFLTSCHHHLPADDPVFPAEVIKLSYHLYRLQQTLDGSCHDPLSCQRKLCGTN